MDQAVANMVAAGAGLPEAVAAATRIPADLIGRPGLGRLVPGAAADLVWLGDDLRTLATWVAGVVPGVSAAYCLPVHLVLGGLGPRADHQQVHVDVRGPGDRPGDHVRDVIGGEGLGYPRVDGGGPVARRPGNG